MLVNIIEGDPGILNYVFKQELKGQYNGVEYVIGICVIFDTNFHHKINSKLFDSY